MVGGHLSKKMALIRLTISWKTGFVDMDDEWKSHRRPCQEIRSVVM